MKISPPEFDDRNAESHKLWLAQVGAQHLQETTDPARLLDRTRQAWQQQGRSEEWITQRMTGQEPGNKPTDPMTEPELIFAVLAELSARQIAESAGINGAAENQCAAEIGGCIAAQARYQLERQMTKAKAAVINHLLPESKIKMTPITANTFK